MQSLDTRKSPTAQLLNVSSVTWVPHIPPCGASRPDIANGANGHKLRKVQNVLSVDGIDYGSTVVAPTDYDRMPIELLIGEINMTRTMARI